MSMSQMLYLLGQRHQRDWMSAEYGILKSKQEFSILTQGAKSV